MPIGKVPQSSPMSRKSSAIESSSVDNTIDSRMSNSELLPMELLKVNYVHQCKQAMMRKSNEPPATPHLNNPARFIGYRRQAPTQAARPVRIPSTLSPNSARKPLPPIPPPTVESWLLLSKQPQKTKHSLQALDSDCCCSQSACSCSDSNSDVTEASTVTPDCEKSQSWNYRNVRHDLIRAANASGVKSRADRIARIEKTHSEVPSSSNKESSIECAACLRQPQQVPVTGFASPNRLSPRSRIPKPVAPRTDNGPYNETNVQLQRRVQQLFQQEVVLQSHSEAPRWMFQNTGAGNSHANRQPELDEQQSPRLQNKAKLERVHIRKKRQTLQIVNQLTAERTRDAFQDTKANASYKNQKHIPTPKSTMVREERMKRSSMECCSDSGVSSSNDTKEQQTKPNNMQRDEKCLDCVDALESKIPEKQNPKQADPNDVQNFAKKSLIKATTNELLTAAAVQAKQCNIEREKKLNKLNQRPEPMTSTITISIDDNWVQESCIDPCDDYMETDSLMLTPRPISRSSNSVKIFVCSDGRGSGGDRSNHEQSKSLCPVELSSRNSLSSSGCGESSRDNTSLCDSEQDCCLCSGNQRGSSINCASNDCCRTVGGVFWNNACYEVEADLGPNCCCSVSSCDEDDCSYYEGNFRVELEGIQERPCKVPLRHNKLQRKVGDTTLTALPSHY